MEAAKKHDARRFTVESPEPATPVDRLFDPAAAPASFVHGYFGRVTEILRQVDVGAIERVIQVLLKARDRGSAIYILGNGGSAAVASHFANDLAVGVGSPALPFRAMSLSENTSIVTAVANDFGYSQVFVKQLEAWLTAGDVVIALSASGDSPSVVEAVRYARSRGATCIGFTAFEKGRLRDLVDLQVRVPCETGEYGPAEDLYSLFEHVICNYLRLYARHSPSRD